MDHWAVTVKGSALVAVTPLARTWIGPVVPLASRVAMISFGPTLEGVHSPDERIHIDTVPKFWDFLLGILKAVN